MMFQILMRVNRNNSSKIQCLTWIWKIKILLTVGKMKKMTLMMVYMKKIRIMINRNDSLKIVIQQTIMMNQMMTMYQIILITQPKNNFVKQHQQSPHVVKIVALITPAILDNLRVRKKCRIYLIWQHWNKVIVLRNHQVPVLLIAPQLQFQQTKQLRVYKL